MIVVILKCLRSKSHRLGMKLWEGDSAGNTGQERDMNRRCEMFRECEGRELEETRMNSSTGWEAGIMTK